MVITGHLSKMPVTAGNPAEYQLSLDDQKVELNPLIGSEIRLEFKDEIHCAACGRKTRKSYCQGHCFPCSQRLAACDLCIVRPEKCHYDQGTCREPDWGQAHCMQSHIVYLANTSSIKVGITRATQIPTRWLDQGATQALPVFSASSRYQVGLLEVALKRYVSDKTDWRKMLKGDGEPLELASIRDSLLERAEEDTRQAMQQFDDGNIRILDEPMVSLSYPVEKYPDKVKPLNLDKTPVVQGRLKGIKGQYLILDSGVLNIRKFGSYLVEFSVVN